MVTKIALIGTGNAARHYVSALGYSAKASITAVGSSRVEKAQAFAQELCPGAEAHTIRDILKSSEIDAVIIAVPPSVQPDIAVLAFNSGKNVLCEKPLAPNLEDARRVLQAWMASGKVGMLNFCYRLIPEIAAFKSFVHSNLSSLNLITVEWVLDTRLNNDLTYMWKADAKRGGGVLQNYGSQVIDYLFSGGLHIEILAASQRILFKDRPLMNGNQHVVTGDEVSTVLFHIAGGCPVLMHLSLVSRPAFGHRIKAEGVHTSFEIINPFLTSPAGPFQILDPLHQEVEPISHFEVSKINPEKEMAIMFSRITNAFVDAIGSPGTAYSPDIQSGVRVVETIQEIQRKAYRE